MKKHWNSTILGLIKKNFISLNKEPIDLMSIIVDQIVVSDKFKHNNEGFKYFIGYQEGGIVKPLCIILPQMSGYIKYFEYGSPNMSFLILKMTKCGKNTNKFGVWQKISWTLKFTVYLFMIKKLNS